jgi:hypothetical protein
VVRDLHILPLPLSHPHAQTQTVGLQADDGSFIPLSQPRVLEEHWTLLAAPLGSSSAGGVVTHDTDSSSAGGVVTHDTDSSCTPTTAGEVDTMTVVTVAQPEDEV